MWDWIVTRIEKMLNINKDVIRMENGKMKLVGKNVGIVAAFVAGPYFFRHIRVEYEDGTEVKAINVNRKKDSRPATDTIYIDMSNVQLKQSSAHVLDAFMYALRCLAANCNVDISPVEKMPSEQVTAPAQVADKAEIEKLVNQKVEAVLASMSIQPPQQPQQQPQHTAPEPTQATNATAPIPEPTEPVKIAEKTPKTPAKTPPAPAPTTAAKKSAKLSSAQIAFVIRKCLDLDLKTAQEISRYLQREDVQDYFHEAHDIDVYFVRGPTSKNAGKRCIKSVFTPKRIESYDLSRLAEVKL